MKKLLIVLMALLLPSLLLGADDKFVVEAATKLVQPANTIDRVSKRTLKSKTYETDSIGSSKFTAVIGLTPIHWDSAGVMKEFNFTKTQTVASKAAELDSKIVVEYDQEYKVGPFKIEYLSSKPGKVKYTKRGTSLEFIPAIDTSDVGIKLKIQSTGLKADYILDSKSPTRLAWKYNLSGHDDKKSLAEGQPIYGADGQINGHLPPLVAWDDSGKVVKLTTTITADSLITVVDTAGVTFPVTVDPTIYDSARVTLSAQIVGEGTSAAAARDTTYANIPQSSAGINGYYVGMSGNRCYRNIMGFVLDGLTAGATISAATLSMYNDGAYPATDSTQADVFFGTGSGIYTEPSPWYSQWQGRVTGGAVTQAAATTASFVQLAASGAGYVERSFTAAALDTIETLAGGDTLRLIFMTAYDINNLSGFDGAWQNVNGNPASFVEIVFTLPNKPGITTADSLNLDKVTVILYADADSVGSANMTEWGFKYFTLGDPADTTTISETGSHAAGAFQDTTGGVLPDTSIVVWAFGTNGAGTSTGAVDTLDTPSASGGSSALTVDGRTVNTAN